MIIFLKRSIKFSIVQIDTIQYQSFMNCSTVGVNNYDIFTGCCLTHWGRITHIYVIKLTIIGSDNALSPGPRQAIILASAGISLIGPVETNFSEILIEIHKFSFKKMHLKM